MKTAPMMEKTEPTTMKTRMERTVSIKECRKILTATILKYFYNFNR